MSVLWCFKSRVFLVNLGILFFIFGRENNKIFELINYIDFKIFIGYNYIIY